MLYLLIVPAFLLSEGLYLVRHPKTFRWSAALVWLLITGFGTLFALDKSTLPLVPVAQGVGVLAYWFVKFQR